jgi:hypothetical protein
MLLVLEGNNYQLQYNLIKYIFKENIAQLVRKESGVAMNLKTKNYP